LQEEEEEVAFEQCSSLAAFASHQKKHRDRKEEF